MSILDSLFPSLKDRKTFNIYTNDYINNTTGSVQNDLAMSFTSLIDLDYEEDSVVPFEALEQGQFSSDSKQNQPFNLTVTAAMAPMYGTTVTTAQDGYTLLNTTINTLKVYKRGTTLLTIAMEAPLFDVYDNMILKYFKYHIDASRPIPYFELKFQQIVISETTYGSLPISTISNPQNSSSVNSGLVIPQNPVPGSSINTLGGGAM